MGKLSDTHRGLLVTLAAFSSARECKITGCAGAWAEVRACRKYGVEPNPGFLQALSQKMPEPSE